MGGGGGGGSTPDSASTGFDDFNLYRLLFATVMAVKVAAWTERHSNPRHNYRHCHDQPLTFINVQCIFKDHACIHSLTERIIASFVSSRDQNCVVHTYHRFMNAPGWVTTFSHPALCICACECARERVCKSACLCVCARVSA